MSDPQRQIKQFIGATGDWFQLQFERIPNEKDRIVMSRVTGWAVMTDEVVGPSTYECIEGIDTCGYINDDDYLHYSYVCGQDVAPNGKTWLSVFNETPSFNWGLKDISEMERPR